MKLYDYFRSSAAFRVRIALNLKGIEHQRIPVNLVDDDQNQDGYLTLNPQGLVPSLTLTDGRVLTQSLAIIEYLDEIHPEPPLLPADALGRARVRAMAQSIACDIHPLNNLRVLQYLQGPLGVDDNAKNDWYHHWIEEGFGALETILAHHPDTNTFCHGDTPGLADICLVPQLYNARRFNVDLSLFPAIERIGEACGELGAFQNAHPDRVQH